MTTTVTGVPSLSSSNGGHSFLMREGSGLSFMSDLSSNSLAMSGVGLGSSPPAGDAGEINRGASASMDGGLGLPAAFLGARPGDEDPYAAAAAVVTSASGGGGAGAGVGAGAAVASSALGSAAKSSAPKPASVAVVGPTSNTMSVSDVTAALGGGGGPLPNANALPFDDNDELGGGGSIDSASDGHSAGSPSPAVVARANGSVAGGVPGGSGSRAASFEHLASARVDSGDSIALPSVELASDTAAQMGAALARPPSPPAPPSSETQHQLAVAHAARAAHARQQAGGSPDIDMTGDLAPVSETAAFADGVAGRGQRRKRASAKRGSLGTPGGGDSSASPKSKPKAKAKPKRKGHAHAGRPSSCPNPEHQSGCTNGPHCKCPAFPPYCSHGPGGCVSTQNVKWRKFCNACLASKRNTKKDALARASGAAGRTPSKEKARRTGSRSTDRTSSNESTRRKKKRSLPNPGRPSTCPNPRHSSGCKDGPHCKCPGFTSCPHGPGECVSTQNVKWRKFCNACLASKRRDKRLAAGGNITGKRGRAGAGGSSTGGGSSSASTTTSGSTDTRKRGRTSYAGSTSGGSSVTSGSSHHYHHHHNDAASTTDSVGGHSPYTEGEGGHSPALGPMPVMTMVTPLMPAVTIINGGTAFTTQQQQHQQLQQHHPHQLSQQHQQQARRMHPRAAPAAVAAAASAIGGTSPSTAAMPTESMAWAMGDGYGVEANAMAAAANAALWQQQAGAGGARPPRPPVKARTSSVPGGDAGVIAGAGSGFGTAVDQIQYGGTWPSPAGSDASGLTMDQLSEIVLTGQGADAVPQEAIEADLSPLGAELCDEDGVGEHRSELDIGWDFVWAQSPDGRRHRVRVRSTELRGTEAVAALAAVEARRKSDAAEAAHALEEGEAEDGKAEVHEADAPSTNSSSSSDDDNDDDDDDDDEAGDHAVAVAAHVVAADSAALIEAEQQPSKPAGAGAGAGAGSGMGLGVADDCYVRMEDEQAAVPTSKAASASSAASATAPHRGTPSKSEPLMAHSASGGAAQVAVVMVPPPASTGAQHFEPSSHGTKLEQSQRGYTAPQVGTAAGSSPSALPQVRHLPHAAPHLAPALDSELNIVLAYALWMPLGVLGLHHVYLRRPGMAVLYFLTLGLFGLGWLSDVVRLPSLVREANDKARVAAALASAAANAGGESSFHRAPASAQDGKPPAPPARARLGSASSHSSNKSNKSGGKGAGSGGQVPGVGDSDYTGHSLLATEAKQHAALTGVGAGAGAEQGTLHASSSSGGSRLGAEAARVESVASERAVSDVRLLATVGGFLGLHHIYMRRPGRALLYLLTLGLLGIGWVRDAIRARQVVEDALAARQARPSTAVTRTLAITLGFTGAHHFYLGRHGWGMLYLCTVGLFGFGWLVDAIRADSLARVAYAASAMDVPGRRESMDISLLEHQIISTRLLAATLGFLGAHHWYNHRWGWGALYTVTGGLCGVGWIVDCFRARHIVITSNSPQQPGVKRPATVLDAYILSFPLGMLGLHQFYLRRYGWGVLYLCTGGCLGIGWLIDLARMHTLVERANARAAGTYKGPAFYTGDVASLMPMGLLGLHHFYMRRYLWGILYLCTGGLLGVGWLADMCRLHDLATRSASALARGALAPTKHRRSQLEYWTPSGEPHLGDAYVLAVPFGLLGLHHFYLRRYAWGCLYLCTGGLVGVGWLADLFRMPRLVSEAALRERKSSLDSGLLQGAARHAHTSHTEPPVSSEGASTGGGDAPTSRGYVNVPMCTVCEEEPVATVMLPCGHSFMCLSCGDAMRRRSGGASGLSCPVCHRPVTDIHRLLYV